MIDRALMAECHTILSGHQPHSVSQQLQALAQSPHAGLGPDRYGGGGATSLLESHVAELTGSEAVRFVSRGVVAQMTALRVWTTRSGRPTAAVHQLSHFNQDEMGAVERLHNLALLRCGDAGGPFTTTDLEDLGELPGVVSVELPLRNAGYKLTPWDELTAIADWCKANKVPLHLDGARAWGAAIAYGKTLSDIANLADSIYLSFYKELGGLYGCVLCASADFIADCEPWLARHGGAVFRQFPAAISALDGLDQHLPSLPAYADRARRIAAEINKLDGAFTIPPVPHTNGFQIGLQCPPEIAEAALDRVTRETGIWMASSFYRMARQDQCCFDVEIGTAAARLEPAQWAAHIAHLIAAANAAPAPAAE